MDRRGQAYRPKWCTHRDCLCLHSSLEQVTCVGRLPRPEPHDGGLNTHRWCLKHEDGLVWDLQVNWGDLYRFTNQFKVVKADTREMAANAKS